VRCSEVIGIYEPLVLVEEERTRHSSIASEPELMRDAGEFYHRACHLDTQGSDP
jgi:hypothetical protein